MGVPAAIFGGAVASGAINALSTIYMNKKNIAAQKEVNKQQLDYAKNAYSYAAVDRLRSGLSPLDTQPGSSPNLTAPQSQAPQVPDFGSTIATAISSAQQQKQVDSIVDLNSALKAKAESEANSKDIENVKQLSTLRTQIDMQAEELKKLRNENSAYSSRLEKELQLSQARYDDLYSQIKQRVTLTPSISALNEARTAQANEESRLAGAKADYEYSQNETATNLGIPRSILDSVKAGNAQGMFIYNALTHQANKRISDYDSTDFHNAYRSYLDSYNRARSELDEEIKRWNSNPYHSRFEREELQARSKEIGSKPLSFNEFVKRIK